ncbi:MAG: NUDIX domain-containing protein [Actinomycetes bacterium]
MTDNDDRVVQAAGGVLWRPAQVDGGVEVALVHRPKYDDWSLPKGKLQRREHVLIGALREVEEETGSRAVPGRFLGSVSYVKDDLQKTVRYWAMRQSSGGFAPSQEVDELVWLPPGEARAQLPASRDRPVLERFTGDARATRAVVVVRHASAGHRATWPGDDHDRPLDETGQVQAHVLTEIFEAYDVHRALSADVLRCLETLGPFALRRRVTVESEPLLSESGYSEQPAAAVDRLLEIARWPRPTVVCTQRTLLPAVVAAAAERMGCPYDGPSSVAKGDMLVLHVSSEEPAQVVAVEHLGLPVEAA